MTRGSREAVQKRRGGMVSGRVMVPWRREVGAWVPARSSPKAGPLPPSAVQLTSPSAATSPH